jgi:gamma-glutamyltranspeptidase
VATANVLHDRMADADQHGAPIPLEPRHRPQTRLQPAVICLDAVVGIPIGAMPGRRQTDIARRCIASLRSLRCFSFHLESIS